MKYRFIQEYANYIKKRFMAADMPSNTKAGYVRQIDTIVKRVHTGYITVSECMKSLNNCEYWINDYNSTGETHFI